MSIKYGDEYYLAKSDEELKIDLEFCEANLKIKESPRGAINNVREGIPELKKRIEWIKNKLKTE